MTKEYIRKEEQKTARGGKRGAKNSSPTKGNKENDDDTIVRKKPSLYQPASQVQPDLAEDPSMAATPAEGSDGELDGETQSVGEEQPTDIYGAFIPKKPIPRNGEPPQNRIQVDPHFAFTDDEIGVREHHSKRNNKNELSYSGMDPKPNPKRFHFDQVARGINSAKNKPEDLDPKKVAEFGVHPQTGLPVKGSRNPDASKDSSFQRTDWSKPLAETESIVFVEDGPHNRHLEEQDKPAWHTSRSNWILKTERHFSEATTGDRVHKVIEALDAREKAGIPNKRRKLDSELVAVADGEYKATKDRESRRSKNIQQEAGKAKQSRAWPPRAGPATPQRPLPYDPTKDTGNSTTTYRTPYAQAQMEDRSGLNALAHAAAHPLSRSRPPPQLPSMHYSPPARQQQYQSRYQLPPAPLSPQRPPPQGGLRALAPAPPQGPWPGHPGR
jgi:hypothetical protein